ncbi:GNAT family N-acetyltransferase [Angustibacter sp. McL0619]|uniref:GNAT family N-acetyltransferase n=1 Tax=Angustibacter sp. McL0619 TaxID=3415676 RepID=UPI003CEA401E
MTVEVHDQPERHRYEASVDGEHAGAAYYLHADDVLTFTHTEVDDAFEGQGVGSALVGGALDDVRRRGLKVHPLCPFVRAYLTRHPEYADLVV